MPFANAAGVATERDLIVVRAQDGDGEGWGEAAPWPKQTPADIEATWRQLLAGDVAVMAEPARSAYEGAQRDRLARADGIPMWSLAGGASAPIRASIAVGLADPDRLIARVGELAERYTAIKLKISPGRALSLFRAVTTTFPSLDVGLDANGSFEELDRELATLARGGPAYIEQPFPAGRPDLAAELRTLTGVTIVADEAVTGAEAARRVVEAGAADVVAVKLGRLGYSEAESIRGWARAEGIALKASGLFETSVGKAHTLTIATWPEVHLVDFAPAREHLAADIVHDPWHLVDGHIQPRSSPGIGVHIDGERLDAVTVDAATIEA